MKGELKVVGTGPGALDQLSRAAAEAIQSADTVVGYHTYLNLLGPLIQGKMIISSGMRKEAERCRAAIDAARKGASVVLISGGDAGVYGLAGLVLELLSNEEKEAVRVFPGITSATACAALLGAPLTHDFAVISLSDLLTDGDLIRRRLEMAAQGDFVTVLYNPRGRRRKALFLETPGIFLKHRSKDTPVGIVMNAYRKGQSVRVIRLGDLSREEDIHMGTTVIIGNSSTFRSGSRMITPRGYAGCAGPAEQGF
jgi:precorrin-3B C17-methyltransferase